MGGIRRFSSQMDLGKGKRKLYKLKTASPLFFLLVLPNTNLMAKDLLRNDLY
jgi:hypothetical protein